MPNPPRDARAVADSLQRVGFKTVQLLSDLSRDGMVAALRAFEREAEQADWAVVYYAGHGIEMGGINYLIPVDAALKAVPSKPTLNVWILKRSSEKMGWGTRTACSP